MQCFRYVRNWAMLACLLLVMFVFGVKDAHAQSHTWRADAGAETKDESVQADGFFPNEVWIIAGDSIQWTFVPKHEVHTVTFLAPGEVRPNAPPPVGPPPGTPVVGLPVACTTTTTYTGTNCVSSGAVAGGATYTVTFPSAGNYKLVCLVHTNMNGTVHVLANTEANATLLQSTGFYEDEANEEESALLNDKDHNQQAVSDLPPGNQVLAGVGKIVATGGGTQYSAVVRFLSPVIRIHAGESVTWTNIDPTEPHTVTFGTEPPPSPAPFTPTTQAGLGTVGPDGRLTATVNCPNTATCDADFVQEGTSGASYVAGSFINSGFLQAAVPDRTAPAAGDVQNPPGTTRITITFPVAGNYYYHCALHDTDGMYGEVVVLK